MERTKQKKWLRISCKQTFQQSQTLLTSQRRSRHPLQDHTSPSSHPHNYNKIPFLSLQYSPNPLPNMEAARAMKVAIDAGASLDEMQRVLLKSVKPEDLFMAIRNAAQKEQQQNQSYQPQSQQQQFQQQHQHNESKQHT